MFEAETHKDPSYNFRMVNNYQRGIKVNGNISPIWFTLTTYQLPKHFDPLF